MEFYMLPDVYGTDDIDWPEADLALVLDGVKAGDPAAIAEAARRHL